LRLSVAWLIAITRLVQLWMTLAIVVGMVGVVKVRTVAVVCVELVVGSRVAVGRMSVNRRLNTIQRNSWR
jgi:hypothetical protein